ncbi:MAG: CheR family methyltransferase [Sedimenticola sp.]
MDELCESELKQTIQKRLGISILGHQIPTFHRCCREAIEQYSVNDYPGLCDLVRFAPSSDPVMRFLIKNLTVGESYFFRDKNQMEFIERQLLPELITRRRREGHYFLNFWSAGCAGGQELYSLLLMVYKLLPDAADWNIQCLGSDINIQALQQARQAHFNEWSLRGVDETLRQQAFVHVGDDEWHLRLDLYPAQLRFEYLNLIEDSYPSLYSGTAGVDLILCRNVFIYFDRPEVERVYQRLQRCLTPGGILICGACDPLPDQVDNLQQHQWHQVFFFRAETQYPNEVEKADSTQFTPQKPKPLPHAATHEKSRSRGALSSAGESAEALRERCRIVAGKGSLVEAKALALEALALDDMNPDVHYLLALVELEQGELREAEESLRRTLLLDSSYILGHYQAGLLKLSQGRNRGADKSLQRARKLLEQSDPDSAACDLDETITCKHLLELVQHQQEMISERQV